jgi:uncharacterized membrane protein
MSGLKKGEIEELLEAKVIDETTAFRIQSYYAQKTYSNSWLQTIFSVIGALLLGLGTILIIAHNWDIFPKGVKTGFAFLPLLIGQGLVYYALKHKREIVKWREGSGTFLFFAVGASISLVSQIYNIHGNLANFLLTWSLLVIPLVYLLNSTAVAILYIVLASYYGIELGFSYPKSEPWLYFALLLLLVPHYIKLTKENKIQSLSGIQNVFALSLTVIIPAFITGHERFNFPILITLFSIYNIIGNYYLKDQKFNSFKFIGHLGTLVILFIYSFEHSWHLKKIDFLSLEVIFLAVLSAIGIMLIVKNKKIGRLQNMEYFSFLIFIPCFLLTSLDYSEVSKIIINLFILLLSVIKVITGVNNNDIRRMNYGMLILIILIAFRFFDTQVSFIYKGLVFMMVGLGFFVLNYKMLKLNKNGK